MPAARSRRSTPRRRTATTLDANRHIADALGALRAREAVPALTAAHRLARRLHVQVAAVDALGRIGDPAAVDTLVGVATGEAVEPFTAKKALLALGRDRRRAAPAPAVLRMLFEERPGVSFFPEAAFAAVADRPAHGGRRSSPCSRARDADARRLGAAAGRRRGALYAKSAQLLGDVGGAGRGAGAASRSSPTRTRTPAWRCTCACSRPSRSAGCARARR